MSIMKAFNEVRGNLAAKALQEVIEKSMSQFDSETDYDGVMSAMKSVTEDAKAQKAYFKLSDFRNGGQDSKVLVYHNVSKFMNNVTQALGGNGAESVKVTQEQRRDFLGYAISNKMTSKLYEENPATFIENLNNLTANASSDETMEVLSFVESRYPLSGAVHKCSSSSGAMAQLAGFFANMTNDDNSNDAAINHLRQSEAFQTACQSEKFMESIYDNYTLRDSRVSVPRAEREPI